MNPNTGLETSSAEAESFAAERPRSWQYNVDRGESQKSLLTQKTLKPSEQFYHSCTRVTVIVGFIILSV
jgi:hypothetical protein